MCAYFNTESSQFLLGTCDVPLIDISFVSTSQSLQWCQTLRIKTLLHLQSPQSTVMNAFQLSLVCDDLCRSSVYQCLMACLPRHLPCVVWVLDWSCLFSEDTPERRRIVFFHPMQHWPSATSPAKIKWAREIDGTWNSFSSACWEKSVV